MIFHLILMPISPVSFFLAHGSTAWNSQHQSPSANDSQCFDVTASSLINSAARPSQSDGCMKRPEVDRPLIERFVLWCFPFQWKDYQNSLCQEHHSHVKWKWVSFGHSFFCSWSLFACLTDPAKSAITATRKLQSEEEKLAFFDLSDTTFI